MGWGDVAKEALTQAHETYKALLKLQVLVETIKDETDRRERRTNDNILGQERRVVEKISEFEKRLRELERENADLRGKIAALEGRTTTVFLEAIKTVILDPENRRRAEAQVAKIQGDGAADSPLFKVAAD